MLSVDSLEAAMELGVAAFVTDRGLGICDVAAQIEHAGLESLFLVQNTHVPVSGTALLDVEHHERDHHFLDPFVALGAAAAVTTRIRLGTGICVAPIYDPIILAMQVSTIDQLSAGRFVFGIGVGHEDTVENHGVSPALRGQVMREKVLAMKALWSAGDAEFHGEFVDFAPVLTGLRPVQEPHPPILVGGQGSRGIAHTVAYGDGWMPIVYQELDFAAQMQELERCCQDAGRPTAPVTAALWEIDEPLMERCAGLGVDRCLVVYHAEDQDNFPVFLERYSRLVDRFR
jgi:probable F420-dependent oxidoreductase